MPLSLISYDEKEVLKTIAIGVLVSIVAIISFYIIWLNNKYFKVPRDHGGKYYNFSEDTGFYSKMNLLISDIFNHDYWINKIGFDGYCYLLFLRKILKILIIYFIIELFGSFIFWVLKNIMNMGYMRDKAFEENGTNTFIIIMMFVLTSLILVGIKNFRR